MTGIPRIPVPGVVLRHLAKMICGDEPYTHFPYRSSSYLTGFFEDLFLDYQHDGSTRRVWVHETLEDIAEEGEDADGNPQLYLTGSLARVIVELANPLHFQDAEADYERAMEDLDHALRQANLSIQIEEGRPSLVALKGGSIESRPSPTILTDSFLAKPKAFTPPESVNYDPSLISAMMPFGGLFDEIYEEDIQPVIKKAGYDCRRADEIWREEVVIDDVVHLLYNSEAVVADLSNRNPNVFYELGIAHTMGKTVIPIVQDSTDIPFDIKHHRYLEYKGTTDGRARLREKLAQRLDSLS